MLKLSGFSESSYKLMIPSLYVISKFTLEKNDDNPALPVKNGVHLKIFLKKWISFNDEILNSGVFKKNSYIAYKKDEYMLFTSFGEKHWKVWYMIFTFKEKLLQ